jgi:uncharacterized ferritin-like protein (DUF455 family)
MLYLEIYQALMATNIIGKVAATRQCQALWLKDKTALSYPHPVASIAQAGLPASLQLVAPQKVKRRGLHTPQGIAALLHALCHIEFNAINLALDAVYRFIDMPPQFYMDWLQVAVEEAYHFELLHQQLNILGYTYGSFPAHHGLWEMARKTEHDVMIRMALVPRILEARGLDVTPQMQYKLRQVGQDPICAILDIILQDEIGHVEIGNRWYHYCCRQRGLNPLDTFRQLYQAYQPPKFSGALNKEARRQAGFIEAELDLIQSFS